MKLRKAKKTITEERKSREKVVEKLIKCQKLVVSEKKRTSRKFFAKSHSFSTSQANDQNFDVNKDIHHKALVNIGNISTYDVDDMAEDVVTCVFPSLYYA